MRRKDNDYGNLLIFGTPLPPQETLEVPMPIGYYVCVICEEGFVRGKKSKAITCSQQCAGVLRNRNRSEETRERLSLLYSENQSGSKNTNWKSSGLSYSGVHAYVRGIKAPPKVCEACDLEKPLDLRWHGAGYYRCISCLTISNYWEPGMVCQRCEIKGEEQMEMERGN